MKPIDTSLPEKKPPRIVTLYLPAAFGISAGIAVRPMCDISGYQLVLSQIGCAFGGFLFSWPFIMAGYHGYRFFRSLFLRT